MGELLRPAGRADRRDRRAVSDRTVVNLKAMARANSHYSKESAIDTFADIHLMANRRVCTSQSTKFGWATGEVKMSTREMISP